MTNPSFSFQIGVRTLWQEARGEPAEGQRAVAHVLVNRLRSGKWGKTLAEVCLSPLQFSGWNARDPNRMAAARVPDNDPLLAVLARMLTDALNSCDADPTDGAMFYYAPSGCSEPAWVRGDPAHNVPPMTFCGKFGEQLFYK